MPGTSQMFVMFPDGVKIEFTATDLNVPWRIITSLLHA
jgi:hypothetical protein